MTTGTDCSFVEVGVVLVMVGCVDETMSVCVGVENAAVEEALLGD